MITMPMHTQLNFFMQLRFTCTEIPWSNIITAEESCDYKKCSKWPFFFLVFTMYHISVVRPASSPLLSALWLWERCLWHVTSRSLRICPCPVLSRRSCGKKFPVPWSNILWVAGHGILILRGKKIISFYYSIPRFKHNGDIKGFAFVEFENANNAQEAVQVSLHFAFIIAFLICRVWCIICCYISQVVYLHCDWLI